MTEIICNARDCAHRNKNYNYKCMRTSITIEQDSEGDPYECCFQAHCSDYEPPLESEKRDDIKWATGDIWAEHRDGFRCGPFDTIQQALDTWGKDNNYIYEINATTNKVTKVYRWNTDSSKWEKRQ